MEIPVVALTQPPPGGVPVAVLSAGSSHGALAGTRRDILCAECGFGAVVVRPPDRCPMCGGTSWHERVTPRGRGK
jgi:hypothetical protein